MWTSASGASDGKTTIEVLGCILSFSHLHPDQTQTQQILGGTLEQCYFTGHFPLIIDISGHVFIQVWFWCLTGLLFIYQQKCYFP